MPEPMAPANTPEKSTENIQNTWQIKMYVVEFIQPKDLNIIWNCIYFLYEID